MGNSNGLAWALSMFGLDLVEFLALIEVVFADSNRGPDLTGGSFIQIYFIISTASMALQLLGVLLVAVGYFRIGGVIQIVSSAVHAPKGEGIIGIVGGVKAYRYPEVLAARAAAVEDAAAG